jgi:hypothetical protein
LNEFGPIQLSSMSKGSPVTGPMRMQPVGRTLNMPTPMGGELTKAPSPKKKSSTGLKQSGHPSVPDCVRMVGFAGYDACIALKPATFLSQIGKGKCVGPA